MNELLTVHEEYLERLDARIERYRGQVIDLSAALRSLINVFDHFPPRLTAFATKVAVDEARATLAKVSGV